MKQEVITNEFDPMGYGMPPAAVFQTIAINSGVYINSGGAWLMNTIENIESGLCLCGWECSCDKYPLASVLNNDSKDGTAVVLAAGPSLERRKEECLAEVEDADIVIGVDRIVGKTDIPLDIVVCADANPVIGEFIKDIKPESKLIMNMYCNPEVCKEYQKKVDEFYWMFPINPFGTVPNIIYRKYGEIGTHFEGSVVTYASVDVAIRMGYKRIVVFGNDLCWENEEEFKKNTPDGYKMIPLKSGKVTVGAFLNSVPSFEALAKIYPQIEFINKSNGLIEDAPAKGWKNL